MASDRLPASGLTLACGWGLLTSGSWGLGGSSSGGLGGSSGLGLLGHLLSGGCGDDGSSDLVSRGSEAGPSARSGRLRGTGGHGHGSSGLSSRSGSRRGVLGLLLLNVLGSGSFGLLGGLVGGSSRGLVDLRSLFGLGSLLSRASSSNLLSRGLVLCNLLELLVDLGQVLLAAGDVGLRGLLLLRNSGGGSRLFDAVRSRLLKLLLFLGLLGKVAEDIVQDKVTVGLLGEDEGLDETLVGLTLVGDLANDLDDDVGVRALGVDVGDADFGVLEVELLDALVDGLSRC